MLKELASDAVAFIDRAERQVELLEPQLLAAEQGDVIEYARAFVQMRRVKDKLDELEKRVSKIYEVMKVEKLPAKFEEAGVPTINLDEGFRISVSHRVFASIKTDRKSEAYDWLRQNNLGDIISETVNSSTLSAVAKSMAEDNLELDADIFNVAVVNTTSVTKTKAK